MKKFLNRLLVLLFAITVLVPTFVFAEGEEDNAEQKEPVTVYFFHGNTCPHCADALEWFESDEVQEQYGDYFKLEKYEVYSDKSNAELMDEVAEYLDAGEVGVPFIIIGEHSTSGFLTDEDAAIYGETPTSEELISWIQEEYEKDEADRVHVVPTVIENTGWVHEEPVEPDTTVRDIIIVVVTLVIIAGIVFVVIKARKEN